VKPQDKKPPVKKVFMNPFNQNIKKDDAKGVLSKREDEQEGIRMGKADARFT
jgi:hypothetical protein